MTLRGKLCREGEDAQLLIGIKRAEQVDRVGQRWSKSDSAVGFRASKIVQSLCPPLLIWARAYPKAGRRACNHGVPCSRLCICDSGCLPRFYRSRHVPKSPRAKRQNAFRVGKIHFRSGKIISAAENEDGGGL